MTHAEIEQALKEGRTWLVWKPNSRTLYSALFVAFRAEHIFAITMSGERHRHIRPTWILSMHEIQKAAEHAAKCWALLGKWFASEYASSQIKTYEVETDRFGCTIDDEDVPHWFPRTASIFKKAALFDTRAEADAALKEQQKPNNQKALEQLREWLSRPDDLGDDWWDEFEKALKAHRLNFGRIPGQKYQPEKKWWERKPNLALGYNNLHYRAIDMDRIAASREDFESGWRYGFNRGRWYEQERLRDLETRAPNYDDGVEQERKRILALLNQCHSGALAIQELYRRIEEEK